MYQYDDFDQTLVEQRVEEFRDQVARRLNDEISEDEFRPLRLMNGLYNQIHAYMLRIAVPYGLLSSEQLRMLAHIARKYDKGYGHFTTRQNLQFHWPELQDVPDILADLAKVEMHAIQTSGNCIRNVTSDQFAGVAADELEDPRPWCEIIRQWSTFHPEFAYLPRKFKIAVTGAEADRAAVQVHDIGLRMVKNEAGESGFEVLVGGGLGRTPVIGQMVREFLPKKDLLSYLEAILRIYNRLGRRDNKFKARIKIMLKSLGREKLAALIEKEWEKVRDSSLVLEQAEIDRVSSFFQPPQYESLPATSSKLEEQLAADVNFKKWYMHNVAAHKQPGYAIVTVSLKDPDISPGDMTHEQMDKLAELADQYSFGESRVTHHQNMVLADVKQDDLFALWQKLEDYRMARASVGTLTDMICCPGLNYCGLANAYSIPIAQQIHERFDDLDYLYDLGNIRLNISGCMNACGHHHVGNIGILGVDKKGESFYQVTVGGSSTNDANIGRIVGPAFSADDIVDAIEKIVHVYVDQRNEDESFTQFVDRSGVKPFKEALYGKKSH